MCEDARALPFSASLDMPQWRCRFKQAYSREGYAGFRLKASCSEAALVAQAVWQESPVEPAEAPEAWSSGHFDWMGPGR